MNAQTFKVRDIVQCSRLGRGNFKVIDKRMTSSEELRLQSLEDPATIEWIYAAHCTVDPKTMALNMRSSRNDRMKEVNKILSKPKRKF